jgi:protein-tyrosine phosphatase
MEDNDKNGIDRLFWSEVMKEPKAAHSKASLGTRGRKTGQRPSCEYFWPQCRHWRQRFALEGEIHIFASAWMDKPVLGEHSKNVGFGGSPDIGLYLDTRWADGSLLISPGLTAPFIRKSNRARTVIYPWEDWGLPENPKLFVKVIRWLLSEAKKGETIEVACMGGHGRTGTALATMLVVQGLEAKSAIRRVRRSYCEEAIESDKQLAFLRAL